MTIRKTLLIAFLFVGLVSAILLATLAFVKARDAVQAEIERSMAVEANGIGGDIDKMMFERLQNAVVWSRLDIMQDLQVRDVDKRLSRFLADLKQGYQGVYVNLFCSDASGRIIASSAADQIGGTLPPTQPWLQTSLSGTRLELAFEKDVPGVGVVIEVAVPSAFGTDALGMLHLHLDWTEIDDVLDQAGAGGRMLAVLDRDGRLIAASRALRARELLLGTALADWRATAGAVVRRDGAPLSAAQVIVGGAASRGYGPFAGFGWTTLIIQPVDVAFAPVHRMALIFAALLALIAVFTVVAATWVSHALARPIVALTAFARGYMRNKALAPPAARSGEIGELSDAFTRMIADIERSQQNLVRASKLAVIGEMSSVIAHEVRTPLGILRSSAQMLNREPAISPEGRELAGFIESETERLNRLVSAMLDSARPRHPSFAPVDLHVLIRRTVAMLAAQAESRNVAVEPRLDAADATIECDEEQMTQVVLNLLVNGLQILEGGGRIEIATAGDAAQLAIEIADDGPGIDPAERTRIFEAFFFRREGGIGLGLAVVQQIVAAHDGEISADASPLGGALFRIRLPRRRAN